MIGKSSLAAAARGLVVVATLGLMTIAGCGATQFEPKNRRLLEALQTAVTSKNSEWLDAVAKQADEEHQKRSLSDAEFQSLRIVIHSAKAGDWKTAESRVFALSEGQRPTAEDLVRVRDQRARAK